MLLLIQNDAAVPPGLFAPLLAARRVPVATWRPFAGEPPPEPAQLSGCIVLGGYLGVQDLPSAPALAAVRRFMADLLARDLPQLGICLGGQLLADLLGAEVFAGVGGERGCQPLQLSAAGQSDPLFAGFPASFPVFQWHNDSFAIPPGAEHLAFSAACPGQALRSGRAWGVQFHPEVDAAIVASWRRKCGADPALEADFAAHRRELEAGAARLLDNFLAIAGR